MPTINCDEHCIIHLSHVGLTISFCHVNSSMVKLVKNVSRMFKLKKTIVDISTKQIYMFGDLKNKIFSGTWKSCLKRQLNYIDETFEAIKCWSSNLVGIKCINKSHFHSRLFYLRNWNAWVNGSRSKPLQTQKVGGVVIICALVLKSYG